MPEAEKLDIYNKEDGFLKARKRLCVMHAIDFIYFRRLNSFSCIIEYDERSKIYQYINLHLINNLILK